MTGYRHRVTSKPQWIAEQQGFDDLCDELAATESYALDTEFHRERTYYPQVALVQVAWPGGTALVDPHEVDLAPLARVLDSDALLVAHAAEQDLEVLDKCCSTLPKRLLDTQVAAGFLGFSSPSLGTLVQGILGTRLPKADRLTDWNRRPLSDAQIGYAAADVTHLLGLRDEIMRKLESAGRVEWAEQECEELLRRATVPNGPARAWWRMKDARSLRGRARGIAQAVAEWRERQAMAQDLPPRFVLPDMAMAGIVQRPPTNAGDLNRVRGLEGRNLKPKIVEGLLAAVRRGSELPESELQLPPVDDLERELRPAIALVAAWIAQLARDVQIDASLLATRADLNALLRGDERARLATGWRAALLGDPIRKLVGGEAALAFAGGGQLVLEARSRERLAIDLDTPDSDLRRG